MRTGLQLLLGLLVMPLAVMATEVKSPNGNVVLNFTIEQGRPVYRRQSQKPSGSKVLFT